MDDERVESSIYAVYGAAKFDLPWLAAWCHVVGSRTWNISVYKKTTIQQRMLNVQGVRSQWTATKSTDFAEKFPERLDFRCCTVANFFFCDIQFGSSLWFTVVCIHCRPILALDVASGVQKHLFNRSSPWHTTDSVHRSNVLQQFPILPNRCNFLMPNHPTYTCMS